MLSATGKKEKLSASKGSEIEVSSNESTNNVWYRAILQENLAVSKRKKLSVRHLNPLSNEEEDYSPPLITTAVHRLIRPLPPPDPSSPEEEADFEEGDVVDAVHRGGWWCGWVVRVLPGHRFLVYLKSEPDVIEVDRKEMRTHMVWNDDEWFRCEKRHLRKSDYSAGVNVEVKTKVEEFGDIWVSGIAIMEKDEELLVKYKSLRGEEDDEWTKTSVPYSQVRPPPPPFDSRAFGLTEHVDALLDSGWCPSVVSKVLCGERYTVLLGPNKQSRDFDQSQLRPSMEWKDGAWVSKEKVSDKEESLPAAEEAAAGSSRIRVKVRATRSSSCAKNLPPASSDVGKESVTENESKLIPQTAAQLSEDLTSKMADDVVNGNTPVAKQPEIAEKKEFHSSVVLGVAAIQLTKTQGKTTPRKKQTVMKNQKGSSENEVKAIEESINRESVNKRKRGRQPRKFISTETNQNQKQKTGVDVNGTTADMTDDDDQPLASWIHGGNSSSGQSAPPRVAPDPSVVEKHVVETPKAKDSTMVLPFAKKSPCWKVLESMEIFKAVPQRPHFSPLLQCEEESREGDAIGAMVNFTGLLEKLSNLQVDSSVSAINRIKESFLKLEKHGFDITAPLSRIDKLLSIKENQTWALEELQAAEREVTESDNKRRKCEEDIEQVSEKIVELQKQEALLKEAKVMMDKEVARKQTHAAVLDQKVQNVEQEFQETVTLPW